MTNRFFYACRGIFISDTKNLTSNTFIHGVQSAGVNNNVDYINFPDIGRSQQVTIEGQAQHEVTIERVLSNQTDLFGYKLANYPATYAAGYFLNKNNFGFSIDGDDANDIRQFDLKLVYDSDTNEYLDDTALDVLELQRCLLTNLSINMDTQGPFTESMSFIGKKLDYLSSKTIPAHGLPTTLIGEDELFKRKHFDKANSILPSELNINFNEFIDGSILYGIKNIQISVSIEYNTPPDIGTWRGSINNDPYLYTTISLPLNIEVKFDIVARRSQQYDLLVNNNKLTNQQIRLVLKSQQSNADQFNVIDLGSKNRLVSISESGGDTSGGNVEYSFTYSNANNDFSYYITTDINNVVTQALERF